jgi:hypothetical protein
MENKFATSKYHPAYELQINGIIMIEKLTGKIQLAQITLWPMMPKELFEGSPLRPEVLRVDKINDYTTFYIKPQSIDNVFFGVELSFNPQDRLFMVSFYRIDREDCPYILEASQKREIKNKQLNDKLLANILGRPPYNFQWGEVTSLYYAQSSSSNITIRYLE